MAIGRLSRATVAALRTAGEKALVDPLDLLVIDLPERQVLTMVRAGAVLTMIGFAVYFFVAVRRERAASDDPAAAASRT